MWFGGWHDIFSIILATAVSYIVAILTLRLSGKRTLSQLNAFDFIVTIALGSILASTVTTNSVPVSNGLTAFVTLIFLQLLITWTSGRWRPFQKLIKSKPRLLMYEGRFLEDNMQAERITDIEILSAMRASGVPDISAVRAVILETNGKLSVISSDKGELSTITAYDKLDIPDKIS